MVQDTLKIYSSDPLFQEVYECGSRIRASFAESLHLPDAVRIGFQNLEENHLEQDAVQSSQ